MRSESLGRKHVDRLTHSGAFFFFCVILKGSLGKCVFFFLLDDYFGPSIFGGIGE